MVAGRSSEPRTLTVNTTLSSTAITAAAGSFNKGDVGRSITGTGIPAGATIATVTSDTAATLSAAATATGAPVATFPTDATSGYGFYGWSSTTDAEAGTHTVAAVNAGQVSPGRITDQVTANTYRARG